MKTTVDIPQDELAEAMRYAVDGGRLAYLAGRMPKRLYAKASSPLDGIVRRDD
jgi:thiazole synthase